MPLSDESGDEIEHERCCDQDYGGSHYHCANCGLVSSMFGHYSAVVFPLGYGGQGVKIPGAMTCSREWEQQVRDVLGDAAQGVIDRVRTRIPLAEGEADHGE